MSECILHVENHILSSMKPLVIGQNIFYSLLVEYPDGNVHIHTYMGLDALKLRETAVSCFLKLYMSEDVQKGECFLTLFVNHIPSNSRIAVTNSAVFEDSIHGFHGLEQELKLYHKEKIKTAVVLYDLARPGFISILCSPVKNIKQYKTDTTIFAIADDYPIFFRWKKEKFLLA